MNSLWRGWIWLACVYGIPSSMALGAARIVVDLERDGVLPAQFVVAGGKFFFNSATRDFGSELWVQETGAAPQLVRDLVPGPKGSDIHWLRAAGNRVVFRAVTDNPWTELWSSDGTEAGTVRLLSVEAGGRIMWLEPRPDGRVWFALMNHDAVSRTTIWETDGTVTGTRSLTSPLMTYPVDYVYKLNDGVLLFYGSASAGGFQLWRTDGTTAGTYALPGLIQSADLHLQIHAGVAYYVVSVAGQYESIWRSDGTVAGTRIFYQTTSFVGLQDLRWVGDRLLFQGQWPGAGRELIAFDPGTDQLTLLADIAPGKVSAFPGRIIDPADPLLPEAPVAYSDRLHVLNERLYFSAWNLERGWELYVSDGTPTGTKLVSDIVPGSESGEPRDLFTYRDRLWFAAKHPDTGEELWSSDGSPAGTRLEQDFRAGPEDSFAGNFTVIDEQLFLKASAREEGPTAWKHLPLQDIFLEIDSRESASYGSLPWLFASTRDALAFGKPDRGGFFSWWRTDGTAEGTWRLTTSVPIELGDTDRPAAWSAGDNTFYWKTFFAGTGWVLYQTEATTGETEFIGKISPTPHFFEGSGSWIGRIGATNYFQANGGGIHKHTGFGGALEPITLPAALNGQLITRFRFEPGRVVWSTEQGTNPATFRVWIGSSLEATPENVWEGTGLSASAGMAYLLPNGRTVFMGLSSLLSSDGTAAGTFPLTGFHASLGWVFGERLFFDDNVLERLCVTDGTLEGTRILPGRMSAPLGMTNGLFLFASSAGGYGSELWVTDGTPEGTRLLKDINPGPTSSFPRAGGSLGGWFWFSADGGDNQVSVWRTDGTASGTVRETGYPGAGNYDEPWGFVAQGGKLFFGGVTAFNGGEMWVAEAGTGSGSRLVNVSTRGRFAPPGDPMIAGVYLAGAGTTDVLLRGIGPTLSEFNVPSTASAPEIRLFAGANQVQSSRRWFDHPSAAAVRNLANATGAFPLGEASPDAAMIANLAPGGWTLHADAHGGTPGEGLVEIYVPDGAVSPINLSTRGRVNASGGLIMGFVISGGDPVEVLLRGVGPGLRAHGVTDFAEDPRIEIYPQNGTQIFANDDWESGLETARIIAASSATGAFALDHGSRDAAIVLTLSPGIYTAMVKHGSGRAGTALGEIYLVPAP